MVNFTFCFTMNDKEGGAHKAKTTALDSLMSPWSVMEANPELGLLHNCIEWTQAHCLRQHRVGSDGYFSCEKLVTMYRNLLYAR